MAYGSVNVPGITPLELQKNLDNLTEALEGKADSSAVEALSTAVGSLSTTLSTKASQNDLDALSTTVGTKADQSSVNNLAYSVTQIRTALLADLDALSTTVSTKAEQDEVENLRTLVVNTTAAIQNVVTDLSKTVEGKADSGHSHTPESIGAINKAGDTMTGTLHSNAIIYMQGNNANTGAYVQHYIDNSHQSFIRNAYYDNSVIMDVATNLVTRDFFLNSYYDGAWHTTPILRSDNYYNYALPLVGGILRGPLSILTDNDQAYINLYNQPTSSWTRVYSNNNMDTVIQNGSDITGIVTQLFFSSKVPYNFYVAECNNGNWMDAYTFLHSGNFAQYINPSSIGGVQIFLGSYDGNAAEERDMYLGFQPTAVSIWRRDGAQYSTGGVYGGFFAPGRNLIFHGTNNYDYICAEVTSTGFKLYNANVKATNGQNLINNTNEHYYYMVFK